MKKILVVLLMAIGLLAPNAITAAEAKPLPSRVTCGDWQNKSHNDTVKVAMPPGGSDEYWSVTATLRFQKCSNGQYAYISYYKIDFQKTQGGACGHQDGSNHTDWRANPNVLGNWNPGEKTQECQTSMTMFWGAPQTAVVFANDDAATRCIGTHLTAVQYLYNDSTADLDPICLFNG